MVRYDRRILGALLDSYENSLLSRGENQINIRVVYPFTKKNIPEYFDESSLAYEEIHGTIAQLEQKGYLDIQWGQGKHIVQKVFLNEKALQEVYDYLGRVPKASHEAKTLDFLRRQRAEHNTPITSKFLDHLEDRISRGKSVKEYIELGDTRQMRQLINALAFIEKNREECYIREFSIQHFGDSKIVERLAPRIGKIFRRFDPAFSDMDTKAILAEYSIYHTPNYVYMKGSGGVLVNGRTLIELAGLRNGIGVAGEDLANLQMRETFGIRKVMTIENLTTFFRWEEPDSLIIYLGGYHNTARRQLLDLIYTHLPDAEYLHFGDIDAGGFEILEDLRRKTGIPFQRYRMDLETLKTYEAYGKPLTDQDGKRLEKLHDAAEDADYRQVIIYMLEKKIKLEQECVVR